MAAKISVPVLPKLIQRERLHKIFKRALRGRVTWIGGPAGSGKTVLAASYALKSGKPCLWYHLDAGDNDPAAMICWIGAAISRLSSAGSGQDLPEFKQDVSSDLRAFGRTFLRSADEQLPAGCILIFDNVEEVDDEAFFHTFICDSLRELTPDKHVVLISRDDPHRLLASFSAGRKLTFINWSALRFTDEEASALIALVGGPEASREAERMQTLVDGWAAGLTLLSTHGGVQKSRSGANEAETRIPSVLFDYIAAELWAHLERPLQDFLLRTTFLPKLTVAATQLLTGRTDAGNLLQRLHHRNLLIVRCDGAPVTYEYHPLFRRFLCQYVESVRSPAEVAGLKTATAAALEETGEIEAAIDLFVILGDWPAVERLLSRHGFALVGQARYQTLACWLHEVPERVIETRPWLRYWSAMSQMTSAAAMALTALKKSYHAFREGGDIEAACIVWASAVEILINLGAYGAEVDFWLDQMQELQSTSHSLDSPHLILRIAVQMFAAITYRRPWHPDAEHWRQQALTLAQELGREEMELRVCFYSLQTLVLSGSSEAGAVVATMDGLTATPGRPPADRMLCKFSHAAVAMMQGRHVDAIAMAREAIDFASEENLPAFKPLLLYLLARAHQNSGDFAKAAKGLAELQRLRPVIGPLADYYFLGTQGIDAFLRGEYAKAVAALDAATKMLGEEALTWAHVVTNFVRGQARSELGLHTLASQDIALLSAIAQSMGNNALLMHQYYLVEAQLALNRADDAAALGFLRQGLALAARVPVCHAYVWRPQTLARLMALALQHDIEPQAAEQIIYERALKPPDLHSVPDRWPRRFRVSMFGGFTLTRDGVRIDERQRSQLALVQYLICHGGRRISLDRVCDDLWPEKDGDRAQQALEVTLSRLRRLLDDKGAIVVANRSIGLEPSQWYSDLEDFRQTAAIIRKNARTPLGIHLDRITALQNRLLGLYRGDLLAGTTDAVWIADARKAAKRLFTDTLSCLTEFWQRTDAPLAAEQCYQRLRELEPGSERVKKRSASRATFARDISAYPA